MKALIEIEMGNAAFGNNEAERLFELRQVTERLIDNATQVMAAKAGDYASAQDTNGNTVARLDIVEDEKLCNFWCWKSMALSRWGRGEDFEPDFSIKED